MRTSGAQRQLHLPRWGDVVDAGDCTWRGGGGAVVRTSALIALCAIGALAVIGVTTLLGAFIHALAG